MTSKCGHYLQSTPLEQIKLSSLKGVGPKTAESLHRLNIKSVADLLFHLPLRYEDRTSIAPIATLKEGQRVLVEGQVKRVTSGGRTRVQLSCQLTDITGSLNLRFFHYSRTQKERLAQENLVIRCFGEVRRGYRGGFEMVHPEYREVLPGSQILLENTLTPIYPATQGLAQTSLRKLMAQALELLAQRKNQVELLPASLLQHYNLPELYTSLQTVHAPNATMNPISLQTGQHPACMRLAFEELIAHQISMQKLRTAMQSQAGYPFNATTDLATTLQNNLSFTLTNAQLRVLTEIHTDLMRPHPMLRLLQGDVGSGKTIVCVLALLHAIEAGYQAVIMAPTELLAEQHYNNVCQWLNPLGLQVGWLTGSVKGSKRNTCLKEIASGAYHVIIGTHALFSDDVIYKSLALLVIDEQHRFGVHQRLALRAKGTCNDRFPHQLLMSATPIPRTLAMSAYGDMDCSVIDELPPGRKPINTVLINQNKRDNIIERVRIHCLSHHQTYWVCPLIEESEALQCQAAEDTARILTDNLSELNVGLIHGRMKACEKEAMMTSFKCGDIHLLVATTVIEVGVDVPNASLMIIENPERLGLAQLHQLRGRVGRGSTDSFCVLLYKAPLSATVTARLSIMRQTCDGFEIAEHDLKMRGPGDVLGTRQAGLIQFKIADLIRDAALLTKVKAAASSLIIEHPELIKPLLQRWVFDSDRFSKV